MDEWLLRVLTIVATVIAAYVIDPPVGSAS